jgi:hypothetical protein
MPVSNSADAVQGPTSAPERAAMLGTAIRAMSRGGSQSAVGDAVLVDVHAAIGNENAASAASNLSDLAAAESLVKQLASQLAGGPASATPAQRSPSPQAVLSLLS